MADPKPHIFDGTKWLSLQGADGAEGPTVVSADVGNVAKLGTDGKLLVDQADLDPVYVNAVGDNMTGSLGLVTGAATKAPPTAINSTTMLQVVRESTLSCFVESYSVGGTPGFYLRRKAGTIAAPTPVAANSSMGVLRWQTKPASGASDRTTAQIQVTATSAETEDGFFDGTMSLSLVGAKTGQSSSFLQLQNLAATGTTATIGADAFVCSAKNFSVNASGGVIAAVPSGGGGAGSFRSNGNGDGQTGLGLLGAAAGTSATSGGVTGVRGEVTGTVSTGIGISSDVTATATVNYGFATAVRGGTRNVGVYVDVPKGTGSYAVQFQGDADAYFKANVGIGWSTPTVLLEVGGATKLRTTLEVVGNITSTGTAHSFAANSIPSPAVIGNAAFTPANGAAAGTAGSMRWDENFLYVRTGTAWKRVALTAL